MKNWDSGKYINIGIGKKIKILIIFRVKVVKRKFSNWIIYIVIKI